MIHFKPSAFFRNISFPAQRSPGLAHAGAPRTSGRADHARMLAHAATRRLAAQDRARGEDMGYWKACAPAAIAKAAAIRAETGFACLP